jgi:hypothetical protein
MVDGRRRRVALSAFRKKPVSQSIGCAKVEKYAVLMRPIFAASCSTSGSTFGMKKLLTLFAILLGSGVSAAHATDYVCQLTLAPPVVDPTRGTFGYVSIFTSPSPNCGGATTERLICSKGATSHACGVNAQYSEAALIGVYESLRSAELAQQEIVPYWNACIGAGGSCVGGVLLYPDF